MKPSILKWSKKYGASPSIIYGVIMAESGGDPSACRYEEHYKWLYHPEQVKPIVCSLGTETVLQKCSIGLMQVMGAVFREYGYRGWLTALFSDIDRQIQYGTKHLGKKIARYGIDGGISAYNAGRPIAGNRDYVTKVKLFSAEFA